MKNILIALFSLFIVACGGGGGSSTLGDTPAVPGDLIAISPVKSLPLNASGSPNINSIVSTLNLTVLQPGLQYSVDYYAVTYATTDISGATVNASGLLIIPKKPVNSLSPLISFQHGTLTYEPWAPSYADGTLSGTSTEALVGFLAAASGYIVAMPDYLGYGVSKNIFHPYVHAQSLATATIDMLRASKQFLKSKGIATNSQLFLTGYSEGGYATLAAQKQMETNLATEFPIAASEPGAGPYDLTRTTQTVFTSNDLMGLSDPLYLTYILKAYDLYYNNPGQLGYYLTSAAMSCANTYFTGYYGYIPTLSPTDYDACLNTTTTDALLNPDFLSSFNGAGETTLKTAIAANDIYNWAPRVATRLYYSPNDDVVPAANSTTAYNTMIMNGSDSVTTATCDSAITTSAHGNCGLPYVLDFFSYFGAKAMNL